MSRQKSPFRVLIDHFVKRLSASEEEQNSGGMGLGLGAVLAILASPGAFASIFLMGKYSTLLEWLRGEHIDAIRRSPSDEYFFIVLSMTITGLVMVTRWNRLFPDRRDFSNLAILPIPVRNIFLANFVALLGLALLFGLDVNAVSALLFPFFVTMSIGTTGAFLRVAAAHGVAVFSASMFSFFAVFGLVGVLMLLMPKRLFRPVSVCMRMSLVVVLLVEFFSNIFLQLFAGRTPGAAGTYIRWLPSYWFLGIYESMVGVAKPPMEVIGRQAMLALIIAIGVSTLAYALCYRRLFSRLPESFDTMGSSRPFFRVKIPEALLRPLFRSQFERACSSFGLKVLTRSEQHLMFFGAYLGIGLVMVAQSALDAGSSGGEMALPRSEYLAIPLLIAFFIISGLRLVADQPASPEANWVFQMAAGSPQPAPKRIARRMMLWGTLSWEIFILGPLSVERLGWLLGILHIGTVIAATVLFADTLLLPFRKVAFTCRTQMDVKKLLVRMIASLFAVVVIVPAFAGIEHWMLAMPLRFVGLAIPFGAAWYGLARYRRHFSQEEEELVFEDDIGPPFELLKLT